MFAAKRKKIENSENEIAFQLSYKYFKFEL